MVKFITLYIQQNLARRHEPTACLNRMLDELAPFSYLSRSSSYLESYSKRTSFPFLHSYLSSLLHNGVLPRIIPIAAVQEPNIYEGKPTGFSGKKVLFKSSTARAALITLNNVNVTLLDDISDRDCAWGLVSYKKTKLAVASFYADINVTEIGMKIDSAKTKCPWLLIMGDSNAHSSLWGNDMNNSRGDHWEQFIINNDLHILNNSTSPTFNNHLGSSNIDLSLTNSPSLVLNSSWKNTEVYNGSDHAILLLLGNRESAVTDKYIQNTATADWVKFRSSLPTLPPFMVSSTSELESRALLLINNMKKAFDIACPKKRAYPGRPCKWWNKALTNLLRNKNLAARQIRKWRGTPRGMRAVSAKKTLGRLFQKRLRTERENSWKSFTNNLKGYKNISALFKGLKQNNTTAMPFLRRRDSTYANSSVDNLNILRETHFVGSSSIFRVNEGNITEMTESLPPDLDSFLDKNLLEKAIASLPNGKAPGPDGLKNEAIKQLNSKYKSELLNQFKSSIRMSFIPSSWLCLEAIYIKKGGKRPDEEPKTYRPIGLCPTLLKLCERLINWRLKQTVLANGIPKQHAFTLGLGTETAISELANFLEKAKCNNQMAMVLSIDIEGAFDSVPFEVITDALRQHGVEEPLVLWIDYLSRNRVITTTQGQGTISFRPSKGTTQGGLNGPDLWIIVLWAIIFTATSTSSKLAKFADDLTSALMGKDLRVIRDVLQSCLKELEAWFTTRGLTISAPKSYCMIVNRGRKVPLPPNLVLNGEQIPYVDSFKFLGVTFDSSLTWKPHIKARISKAKSDLMTARKLVGNNWGLAPHRMAWLYTAIVRPTIDYSCHVWFPPGGTPEWLVRELDKLQRLALTSMTSCLYTTPTRALERLTNIKPLDLHLKQKAASTVARIYNSIDLSNWDGIGQGDKRGHLFSWTKYLGRDLPPVIRANKYNFTVQDVVINNIPHVLSGVSIYTDGSKSTSGVGSGWVIFNDNVVVSLGNRKLPNHSTVYEAEMTAISLALDDLILITNGADIPKDITFLVDNQATLKTLNSLKLHGETRVRLLDKINAFTKTYSSRLHFKWVKGHSNDYGNDIADEQARKGGLGGVPFWLGPSMTYIKKQIRSRIKKEWNARWASLQGCRQSKELISFEPNPKVAKSLLENGRQRCRTMVSIMTGHNHLRYHVFRRTVSTRTNFSPCCRLCGEEIETSWHLLFDCPCIDTRRREFIYSPDNPKTGPDIDWYHDLAEHLGIRDWFLDRKYLDLTRNDVPND